MKDGRTNGEHDHIGKLKQTYGYNFKPNLCTLLMYELSKNAIYISIKFNFGIYL